ncbi:DDE-type integrase/transposase/recombinase [Nocardia takedensis]
MGWKTSDRCDTELVLGALEYAVWARDVRGGQLIHHSDKGSTYTAFRFANRLADIGIAQSMGSVGDSYDCESRRVCATAPALHSNPCPSRSSRRCAPAATSLPEKPAPHPPRLPTVGGTT